MHSLTGIIFCREYVMEKDKRLSHISAKKMSIFVWNSRQLLDAARFKFDLE
jgi:hypothetical protein